MQYRTGSHGEQLSVLGFGALRFTRRGNQVDIDKAEKELMAAIDGGVNYIDTAYIYPGSENALGEILERNHCRDRVYLADKLPLLLIRTKEGIEKSFQEQLKRLRTDHIDYYLMHMLNDVQTWEKFCRWGILEWLEEKKASGQIGRVGFSYHGSQKNFNQVVDCYPWDFCQIQYNYMDEYFQAGREGLRYAHSKGLHVVIMEPLRGGRLVNMLPKNAVRLMEQEGQGRSAAEWAFRWLFDQPEVTMVLSGMNTLEMVEENLRIADEACAGYMSERDHQLIGQVRDEINRTMKVGCTGCGYCMPCSKGVDIPGAFRCYNLIYSESRKSAVNDYRKSSLLRHDQSSASQCIGCGKCESHCPQSIPIREMLKAAASELEGPIYKIMKKAVRWGRFY